MKVLVIGGAGYIGSHTVLALLQNNYEVAVFDNFINGHREAISILENTLRKRIPVYQGDIQNFKEINQALQDYKPDGVIHFAAFAEVGESVKDPLKYYRNNVQGGINIARALIENNIDKLVFSSTCAIFGEPEQIPITEDLTKNPVNPYGRSKYIFEQILADLSKATSLKYVALRYFNACGADIESRIGEDHNPESHLIPLTMDTALGRRESISIFGTDYDTKDGTCIRDYIHVLDLADAHIKALEYMEREQKSDVFNLGTAEGYSVREIIREVKSVSGKDFAVIETSRRPGDPAILIADNTKAREVLGWTPKFSLKEIIESAWKWETTKGSYRD